MWAYVARKLLYNIPVYLGILFLVMAALRVNDPVYAFLGKSASQDIIDTTRREMGLETPFLFDVAFWRGPWKERDVGHGGSAMVKGGGNGRFKVTWTAAIEPGEYELLATWPEMSGAATDAGIQVFDSARATERPEIDQSIPVGEGEGDVEVGGTSWRQFATIRFESRTARLVMTNKADGRVIADAIMLRPTEEGREPIVLDNADAGDDPDPATLGEDPGAEALGPDGRSFEAVGNEWTASKFGRSLWDNQYFAFLSRVFTLNFEERSWRSDKRPLGGILANAIPKSLSITVPTIILSTIIGICIALISAYFRGRAADRILVVIAVFGMSISYLVYIIFGQYWGAALPQQNNATFQPFAISGYEGWIGFREGGEFYFTPGMWVQYCLLPVMIGVVVSIGYDTRFYRAVMVEETNRDYIVTATAKGATKPKIMFVHMLKNAMIPVITRVMSTLPFLITGSILLEMYFRIPGMGFELINAINSTDFPVVQGFVAVLAAFFIVTIILTDVLYALVDPRVRLS